METQVWMTFLFKIPSKYNLTLHWLFVSIMISFFLIFAFLAFKQMMINFILILKPKKHFILDDYYCLDDFVASRAGLSLSLGPFDGALFVCWPFELWLQSHVDVAKVEFSKFNESPSIVGDVGAESFEWLE